MILATETSMPCEMAELSPLTFVGLSVPWANYFETGLNTRLVVQSTHGGTLYFIPEIRDAVLAAMTMAGKLERAERFIQDIKDLIWYPTNLRGLEVDHLVSRKFHTDITSPHLRSRLCLPPLDWIKRAKPLHLLNLIVADSLGAARYLTFDPLEEALANSLGLATTFDSFGQDQPLG